MKKWTSKLNPPQLTYTIFNFDEYKVNTHSKISVIMRFRILQASRTTYDARLSVHKRSNPENKRMQPRSMHKPLAFSRVENELGKKYDERPLYNEQEVEIKKVMMIIMMILFRIKKLSPFQLQWNVIRTVQGKVACSWLAFVPQGIWIHSLLYSNNSPFYLPCRGFLKFHIFVKKSFTTEYFPVSCRSETVQQSHAHRMKGGTFCQHLCRTCMVKRVALYTGLWQTTILDELPQKTHLHCLPSPLQNETYFFFHPAQRRIETAWWCKSRQCV